ncbi:UDP-N-acetylmuramoyl-tripeptide--D-alanyl-D-alanine ligase [Nitrosospira sp. Nsp5]|uniref:UDP-N-acetylmuramoyl-tripeptide--D-alanyl-D-alanine ligase n=1 Tax=Nitrosospira multiformis TaxID=1231 RepID=A0ABY0T5U6_9PROT|nr:MULTISPECIES: UDP-N-acetylmuramoyl-tripeptide--D-alanyl-D-alanine ligase [Nitrosospira]PTR09509.1 UDP-N-acetylmuramoyl-tripeptide--D-alanyl-D-alanine ligase [Nitrosospira sp. Nsp5]SDQ28424.1 UDP-N-acetylmuramoyl-tripeptide--D-alanyl-D-alanine ligase [Nitrosospira multiformis]
MMTVRKAAQALHGEWRGQDARFTAVSTDSRTVKCGDLFVALIGEKFDGHDFIAEVKKKGATAAMVCLESAAESQASGIPLILVKDTRLGLGQLAAHWRSGFSIPMVAVTGSNGKTTVKEMIASILRRAVEAAGGADGSGGPDRVLATEGNLNNDIGVPLMLLRLRERHIYAVIEMGMNHAGEIAYLTRLAKPGVALITNAGAAHVEGLGSVQAVACAKGEIFEGLDQHGIAVINADDPNAPLWRKLAGSRKVVDFGLGGEPKVSARYQLDFLGSGMTLILPEGVEEVELQVPGEHNVRNALAAAAVAVAMGIDTKVIASGLREFCGVKGRLQKKRGLHDAILIDDSYNANPESVRAALAVLAKAPGKKILVLGDMGELGDSARDFHERIGEEARLAGIDGLFALGELSAYAVAKFGPGARHFDKIEELLAEVRSQLAADVTFLIKGSRFMHMERVVKHIEL